MLWDQNLKVSRLFKQLYFFQKRNITVNGVKILELLIEFCYTMDRTKQVIFVSVGSGRLKSTVFHLLYNLYRANTGHGLSDSWSCNSFCECSCAARLTLDQVRNP